MSFYRACYTRNTRLLSGRYCCIIAYVTLDTQCREQCHMQDMLMHLICDAPGDPAAGPHIPIRQDTNILVLDKHCKLAGREIPYILHRYCQHVSGYSS